MQGQEFSRPAGSLDQHSIGRRLIELGVDEVETIGFNYREDGMCPFCIGRQTMHATMIKIKGAQTGVWHWVHPHCAAEDLRSRGIIDAATYRFVLGDGTAEAYQLSHPRIAATLDEQSSKILAIERGPPGAYVFEAGGGAGKSTIIGKLCARSHHLPSGASSATNAAVRTLEHTPGVVKGMASTAHAIGLQALTTQFQMLYPPSATGVPGGRPRYHATKIEIMLQTLCPPDSSRPYDGAVSLLYKVNIAAIKKLYNSALLHGSGIKGHPPNSDHESLLALCKRYRVIKLLEAAHDQLSDEDKEAYAEIIATAEGAEEREAGFERRVWILCNLTTIVLDEAVKVSTQPSWEGQSQIVNALDSDDVMVLPAVIFPCMLNHAVQNKAPILLRCGRKALRLYLDEAQDLSIAAVELLLSLLDQENGKLIVFCDTAQREFAFAAADPVRPTHTAPRVTCPARAHDPSPVHHDRPTDRRRWSVSASAKWKSGRCCTTTATLGSSARSWWASSPTFRASNARSFQCATPWARSSTTGTAGTASSTAGWRRGRSSSSLVSTRCSSPLLSTSCALASPLRCLARRADP